MEGNNRRRCRLLNTSDAIAIPLQQCDNRVPSCQMARANSDHDGAGLCHALLDPFAPICVTLVNQRLRELRRASEVAVERPCDPLDITLRPGLQHAGEFSSADFESSSAPSR